ncbi:SDR family NAD(P)-dependent oxidoreductase [Amycolatopsis rubida]|uniref:NAD(P)-dependent dehydrogenase, short-chain alcohol dehydrogenase family n=1 Tax=Amycolatopsis rubida TaxID=112413 RepID=A0A1I5SJL7_9PSEU|nr:SDR family oxidoreductase [Amycolatopsis rubida]SFP70841.1 NAD(P)-dependent dehydrogenase, short-chain alcohol dehydrogenase family [Amycolatopsis rubida]
MARLAGKAALITGAGAGIGRAAALLFAEHGARVVAAELNEDTGRSVVREIEGAGGTAVFARVDTSEEDEVRAAVRLTVAAFGRLDVLYNNVGGTSPGDGPVTEVPVEVFWQTMKRDLFGTFLMCRHALPELVAAGGGSVINTTSMAALMGKPPPARDCYAIAKGGIVSFTRSMAVQYAPHGIRVNAIAPGVTVTERLAKRLDQGAIPQPLLDRHLLGLLEPGDIAAIALYLASEESRRMTGQIVSVDSGMTIS